MPGWTGASRIPRWSCTGEGMSSASTESVRAKLASIDLSRLVLFLDFDGTLVPLAKRPDQVSMSKALIQILDRLGRRVPIVVVSGRPVNDLRRVIGLESLHYIGLHGFSYGAPHNPPSWLAPRPSRRIVRKWKQALDAVAGKVRGAWVEDKGISVVLHNRQVAARDRRRLCRNAMDALQNRLHGQQIRLLRGKHVMEILPATDCDKGIAVSRILQKPWARSRVPVYFGDDTTDIPALELVARSGVAIQVGSIPHGPKICTRLVDTNAVHELLRFLANRLDRTSARWPVTPVRRSS
jgi:trehalose 6-phosphate phosphatase